MDSNGQVKLLDVVLSYLNEGGEPIDNFFRYLQIVIEGLTKLNISVKEGLRVFFTQVSDVNIVDFPRDTIKINRIGVLDNGKIWGLTTDDDIALPDGDICGVEVLVDDNLNSSYIPSSLNFATGGGYNIGSYRVDYKGRKIIFKGNLRDDTIILEYKSSGISMDGDTYIPVLLMPVLKSYLYYTLIERNRQVSLGEKRRAEIAYINARNDFVKASNSFSYNDLLDAIYSGYSQGVKR